MKMMVVVCVEGVGQFYCIQYSVGLGKINIIVWILYVLICLCYFDGEFYFYSVIVVIDCIVFDKQL